jgi:hypothetical protein
MVSRAQRLIHAFAGALSILFGALLLTSEGFASILSKAIFYPTGYWVFLPGLFIGGILLMLAAWKLHRAVYSVIGYVIVCGEVSLLWYLGFL